MFEGLERARAAKEKDCHDYLAGFIADPSDGWTRERLEDALTAYREFVAKVEALTE